MRTTRAASPCMQRRNVYVYVIFVFVRSRYVQENVNTVYQDMTPPLASLTLFCDSVSSTLFSLSSIANWYTFFHFTRKNEKKLSVHRNEPRVFFGHFTSFHTFLSLSSLLHWKGKLLTVRISQNIFEHLIKQTVFGACLLLSVIWFARNAWFIAGKYRNWADF